MPLYARLLLTLLSVALGIAAFAPLSWHPLALIAWLPFLIALRGVSSPQALLLGLLHGMLLFAGTLIWLVEVFGPMAYLLHFILSLFTILFALVVASIDKLEISPWARGPLIATLWTGIEFYRGEWFQLRFPWITPGTGLPPNLLSPWIGVYGISLIVILGCAWLVGNGKASRIAGLLTIIALAFVCYLPRASFPTPRNPIHVDAVQGELLTFDNYLELSQGGDVDAILWPEYALTHDLRKKPEQLARIRTLLSGRNASFLVVGSRTDLGDKKWSNTALIVGRDEILGTHEKNRPVHFFNDGEPGTEAPAWPTPIGTIATPICFDNDYALVQRQAVANGAELLLIPSMDAAHWTARQHLQHAELFRHRAAENRRWTVVAASSGLTQVIDPHGIRRDQLPLIDKDQGIAFEGTLSAEVELESGLTPYTRFGWLIGPACSILAIFIAFFANLFTRRAQTRTTDHHYPPNQPNPCRIL